MAQEVQNYNLIFKDNPQPNTFHLLSKIIASMTKNDFN